MNDRLADLVNGLSSESSPADFEAALVEVDRLAALFADAPDPEVDRLNAIRRDRLVRGLEEARDGDLPAATRSLEEHIQATDAISRRIDRLV